jgi:transposase
VAKKTDEGIKAKAVQMYVAGMTVPAIAKQLPISESVLYRALAQEGIKPSELIRRGIRGKANRKFTNEQEGHIAGAYRSGKSLTTLANEWNVNLVTIRNVLIRQGIPRRRQGNIFRSFSQDQITDMAKRWSAGESQTQIATRHGTHQSIVARLLAAHGFKKEDRRPKRERHGNWKGGRSMTSGGYVSVLIEPDSPYFCMANSTGYVLEHRLVMAQRLGRPLEPYETVHHINGIKGDNADDNLELRSGKHGTGVTLVCADCGSRNIKEVTVR